MTYLQHQKDLLDEDDEYADEEEEVVDDALEAEEEAEVAAQAEEDRITAEEEAQYEKDIANAKDEIDKAQDQADEDQKLVDEAEAALAANTDPKNILKLTALLNKAKAKHDLSSAIAQQKVAEGLLVEAENDGDDAVALDIKEAADDNLKIATRALADIPDSEIKVTQSLDGTTTISTKNADGTTTIVTTGTDGKVTSSITPVTGGFSTPPSANLPVGVPIKNQDGTTTIKTPDGSITTTSSDGTVISKTQPVSFAAPGTQPSFAAPGTQPSFAAPGTQPSSRVQSRAVSRASVPAPVVNRSPDGTVATTVTKPDGSTVTTTVSPDGSVTKSSSPPITGGFTPLGFDAPQRALQAQTQRPFDQSSPAFCDSVPDFDQSASLSSRRGGLDVPMFGPPQRPRQAVSYTPPAFQFPFKPPMSSSSAQFVGFDRLDKNFYDY
jgi:hypothetical protein